MTWSMESQSGWFVREHTVLVVRGQERLTFLHGMCTQALDTFRSEMPARPGLFTDRQGRILSWAWICCQPEEIWLVCEQQDRRDKLLAWLEQHIIMEDVQLMARDDVLQWHIQCPSQQLAQTVVQEGTNLIQATDTSMPKMVENWPGLMNKTIACVPVAHQDAFQGLMDQHQLSHWSLGQQELYRLQLGIPSPNHEYAQGVQPFEVRLDHHGLVWNKGCYVGQEVLSRLDSYDKVPRLMMGFSCQEKLPLGTLQLYGQDGTWLGKTTSMTILPDHTTLGLAIVKRSYALPGQIVLKTANEDQPVLCQLEDRLFWQVPMASGSTSSVTP